MSGLIISRTVNLPFADKECSGEPNVYANAELKKRTIRLQTQELALTLRITQLANLHCLKSPGMIEEQGYLLLSIKARVS